MTKLQKLLRPNHISQNIISAGIAIILGTLAAGTASAEIVIAVYNVPANSSGLAWDGQYLWMGGIGDHGDYIRAFDPASGVVVDSIRAPVPDCIGLTWHRDRLVYVSPRSPLTFFVDRQGNFTTTPKPHPYIGGVASDSSSLWSATYFGPSGVLIKFDESGNIYQSLPFTGRHSRDMTHHKGRLYVADRLAQAVRVVDPGTARFIRTFETPAVNPDGLASDGEYLWLLDDGDPKTGDTLYKLLVRPDGSMRLSALSHNFGSVVIDDEAQWSVWVYNDGARTSTLTGFEHQDGVPDVFPAHLFAFPQRLAAGDSAELTFSFHPGWEDSVHIRYGLTFDLDRETYWIDLRGKGVRQRRDILVHGRELSFGIARTGFNLQSSNIRHLRLENNGGEPLTVSALQFTDDSFFPGFYEFPYTFEEAGLYEIPIFFRPNRDGAFTERMTIVNDDPDSPRISILLTGTARLENYRAGEELWRTNRGDFEETMPVIRAIQDIDDVTGDGLSDVVVAANDYMIQAFHAAATDVGTAIWTYRTNSDPWRSGLVSGQDALSEGDDWNHDGTKDIVCGLDGYAMNVIALSGRTGAELWKFNTQGMEGGGGIVRAARAEYDFNGDRVRDVFCVAAAARQQNSTNAAFVLNGADGDVIWQLALDGVPKHAEIIPDVSGDNIQDIVIACEDGQIFGIDGRRGRVIWSDEVEGDIRVMVSIRDVNDDGSDDVAFVTFMHGVSMFNGSNGVRLWHVNQVGVNQLRQLTAAAVLNDLNENGSHDLVVGGSENIAVSIDGRTGEIAWRRHLIVGAPISTMESMPDFDRDGLLDFIVGTVPGRLYAFSGNGRMALWSYSNVGEGREFRLIKVSRDIDGNRDTDVFAAMANGTVYAFAGSYVGLGVDDDDEASSLPATMMVDPAYPNPFNSAVNMVVRLDRRSAVDLRVVDVLGRTVYEFNTPQLAAGEHRLVWNGISTSGASLPSGMYLMAVKSRDVSIVKAVELLR